MGQKGKSKLHSAASVLHKLLEESQTPLSHQFKRWKVWSQWPSIVGEDVAPSCMPVGYLRGTLYLWVESSAHMQELSFLVDPIKAAVNKHMGSRWVNKLTLTLDRKSVPFVAVEKWNNFAQTPSSESD